MSGLKETFIKRYVAVGFPPDRGRSSTGLSAGRAKIEPGAVSQSVPHLEASVALLGGGRFGILHRNPVVRKTLAEEY